jgi:hypothetical protein
MASPAPPPPFPPSHRAGRVAARWLPAAGAILVLIVLASAASGAETPSPPLPTLVANLAWLAGDWSGTAGDLEMEETWLEPKGGALLGLHRDVRAGADRAMVSFEYMRIAETAGGIVFYGSPGGKPPTPFALVESGERRAVFANPSHDYPRRIAYWLDQAGALHARIEGASGADPEEWVWRPAPPPAP